jgi:NADH:ubiquinone oxidoreductase subunit E
MLSDQRIWEALREITERTGWPTPAVIDAVAMDYGLDRARVAQVWRERSFTTGAG